MLGRDSVIHVACPVKKTEIFDMVFNCLETATEKQYKSIALAFLSSGFGNFDIKFCSLQYALAIVDFSRTRTNIFVVENIFFIDKDPEKVKVVNEMFKKIIPNDMMLLLEVPKQYYSEYLQLESTVENFKTDAIRDEGRGEPSEDCGSELRIGIGATGCYRDKFVGDDAKEADHEFHHSYDMCSDEKGDECEKPISSCGDARSGYDWNKTVHRLNIRKYTLIIDDCDIRDATTVAIVCPENYETPYGGFLAAALKCKFQRSRDPSISRKVALKRKIATTEVMSDDGRKQYLLHVPVTVWKQSMDKGEFEECLKATVGKVFEKLSKPVHRKRNITSIAIPLLGVESVENTKIVANCCRNQVKTICDMLSSTDIPNLKEVYLLNRCKRITNTLILFTPN